MPIIGDAARERIARVRDAIKMPTLPSWWKRKDVTAERRAIAAQVHPILISGFFIAAYAAAFVEVCFMFLRVVRMVGDYRWRVEFDGAAWTSELSFSLHPALATVLFLASAVVVFFSMLWIPGQLALRGQGALKRLALVLVGIVCNLYILSNVVVGGQANRTEDMRDAMSIEQSAGQSRAQVQARIDDIDTELDRLCDRSRNNDYNAAACNAGEAAYRATALDPALLARETTSRRLIIERAVQSAIRADDLRAERIELRDQLAAAPTEASVASSLTDEAGEGMAVLATYLDAYGYLALGGALSLVAIFGNLWGLGLLQARALLDPTVEEDKTAKPATAPDDANTGPSDDTPPVDDDMLVLPPLPAPFDDPAFAETNVTVDDQGRRLRRVAGSFRAERDAPRSQSDARRPPADDGPQAPDAPPSADGPADGPADPVDDADDPLAAILRETAAKAAAAAQARENASAK